jgi:hypothetical protein
MKRDESATERSGNGENRSGSDRKKRTKNIVSSILTLRSANKPRTQRPKGPLTQRFLSLSYDHVEPSTVVAV